MNKTNWEQKNTVKGENQVSKYVKFEGKIGGNPRILLLGNSIAWHAPKEDIGWSGDWGMAASCKENDFVHRIIADIQKDHPEAYFCIVQGAIWERTYKNCDYESDFFDAKDFDPDIIITELSGNIPQEVFEEKTFIDSMGKLHSYLSGENKKVKIIETSSFGSNEIRDKAIKAYTEKVGAEYIYIGDINKNDENLAKGLFWHEGVAYHPGDVGMKIIADRIIACIKENEMI